MRPKHITPSVGSSTLGAPASGIHSSCSSRRRKRVVVRRCSLYIVSHLYSLFFSSCARRPPAPIRAPGGPPSVRGRFPPRTGSVSPSSQTQNTSRARAGKAGPQLSSTCLNASIALPSAPELNVLGRLADSAFTTHLAALIFRFRPQQRHDPALLPVPLQHPSVQKVWGSLSFLRFLLTVGGFDLLVLALSPPAPQKGRSSGPRGPLSGSDFICCLKTASCMF